MNQRVKGASVPDQALAQVGQAPSGLDASRIDPSRGDRLQRLLDADRRCSEVLSDLFVRHQYRQTHAIECSEGEWNEQTDAFAERDAARAALMPTEQDAIRMMHEGFTRLKDLGWREAMYCPKDGSEFDAVEAGSTGIHRCHYQGEWAEGSWWYADDGDLWPASPVLYRPTESEVAKWTELRAAFAAQRDSDQSPEGIETAQTGSTEGASAGLEEASPNTGATPTTDNTEELAG